MLVIFSSPDVEEVKGHLYFDSALQSDSPTCCWLRLPPAWPQANDARPQQKPFFSLFGFTVRAEKHHFLSGNLAESASLGISRTLSITVVNFFMISNATSAREYDIKVK